MAKRKRDEYEAENPSSPDDDCDLGSDADDCDLGSDADDEWDSTSDSDVSEPSETPIDHQMWLDMFVSDNEPQTSDDDGPEREKTEEEKTEEDNDSVANEESTDGC